VPVHRPYPDTRLARHVVETDLASRVRKRRFCFFEDALAIA
jgi:hypothetical protein